MKKRLIILISLPVIAFLIWYGLPKKSTSPPPAAPTPTPNVPIIPPKITYVPTQTLESTPDYEIYFSAYNQLYTILILNPDFDSTRTRAEQQLLNLLKLKAEAACSLNVSIGTPYRVTKTITPSYFTFSFCEPKQ